jgi:hypothetical protein
MSNGTAAHAFGPKSPKVSAAAYRTRPLLLSSDLINRWITRSKAGSTAGA